MRRKTMMGWMMTKRRAMFAHSSAVGTLLMPRRGAKRQAGNKRRKGIKATGLTMMRCVCGGGGGSNPRPAHDNNYRS